MKKIYIFISMLICIVASMTSCSSNKSNPKENRIDSAAIAQAKADSIARVDSIARAYFGHGGAYTGARRVKNNKFFAGTRLFGGVSAFYTENPRAVHNFFGIFGYSKGLRYDIL